MRRGLIVGIAAVGLLAAACSDDDDGGPSIDSFDVPSSADCSSDETGTVEVSWNTTGASEVMLLVDGAEVTSGADPSGNETLDVPCDGEDHNIGLTALGDDSKSASDTKSVSTETDGDDGETAGTTAPGGTSGTGAGTTTPSGGTTPTTGATTPTTAPNNPTTTGATAPPLPTNVPAPDPGPAAP